MSVQSLFVSYLDPSSARRVLVVGQGATTALVEHADRKLDAGSFRPHLLMDAMAQLPGWTAKFVYASMKKEETWKIFNEKNVGSAAAMWPSMSSEKLITCYIYDQDGIRQPWGSMWDALGIKFVPGQKGFKRLQEITRSSRIHNDECGVRSNGVANIGWVTNEMLNDWGLAESAVDGIVAISKSYALRCAANIHEPLERQIIMKRIASGKIKRLTTLRALVGSNWTPTEFDGGMIKGDGIIVEDKILADHWNGGTEAAPDIVSWTGNLKTELSFADPNRFFITWDPKKTSGPVNEDFQTRSWMKHWTSSTEESKTVITRQLDQAAKVISEGEIPHWAMFDTDYYTSSKERIDPWGNPRSDHAGEIMKRMYLRYQASGLSLKTSSTYISLLTRGVLNHVSSKLTPQQAESEEGTARGMQIWAPAPWSTYGYAITDAFLTHLCGYDLGIRNGLVFWHEESASVVMPHVVWEENLVNVGGGDLDDRLCVLLRWDPDLGQYALVIYRQPNTAGEYIEVPTNINGVQLADMLSFDWHNKEIDPPVLNNRFRPAQASTFRATAPELIPGEWIYGDEYSVADANESIQVAALNSSVGAYMNATMIASSMDIKLKLHATPEQVVDVTQASPYREFFAWHEAEMELIWEQIAASEKTLDFLLWSSKVPPALQPEINTHQGFFTKIYQHAATEIKRFEKETKALGLKIRSENKIEEIMDLEFSAEILDAAQKAINYYLSREKKLSNKAKSIQTNNLTEESPYRKESGVIAKNIINKYANGDLNTAKMIALAIYQLVNNPPMNDQGFEDKTKPYGVPDNVIFNSPPENSVGMIDLFLEACCDLGVANRVIVIPAEYSNTVARTKPLSRSITTDRGNLITPSSIEILKADETKDETLANVMAEFIQTLATYAEDSPESIEAARLFNLGQG